MKTQILFNVTIIRDGQIESTLRNRIILGCPLLITLLVVLLDNNIEDKSVNKEVEKETPCVLLEGMCIGSVTMETIWGGS